MSLTRIFRMYFRTPFRDKIFLISCLIIACTIIILFWRSTHGQSLRLFCSSVSNLQYYGVFERSGVNVIPSVPREQEIGGNISKSADKAGQAVIDPFENECLKVKVPYGSDTYKICIHDPFRDLMVSAHLKAEGHWEKENIDLLYQAHTTNSDLVFVDLGCHIGVFTLLAAKLGMQVVAVDAVLDSLRLLQRSLLINDLACHVTLVHNAVHRYRRKVRLVIDPTNIGGTRTVDIGSQKLTANSQLVDAICINDLAILVKGKSVFLKIDVEGAEAFVFDCADQFFKDTNVKMLLLEWVYLRNKQQESTKVKDFLTGQNMIPTSEQTNQVLDVYASHTWPDHVLWVKGK